MGVPWFISQRGCRVMSKIYIFYKKVLQRGSHELHDSQVSNKKKGQTNTKRTGIEFSKNHSLNVDKKKYPLPKLGCYTTSFLSHDLRGNSKQSDRNEKETTSSSTRNSACGKGRNAKPMTGREA